MHRLVLWDVDGTLVRAGVAGRDVFETAIAHVLGRPLAGDVMPQVSMSGKTDPQIATEILALAGVARGEIDAHLPPVLARLEVELAAAADRIRAEGVVLPGVGELLARLHHDPDVLQSVLTGNLAPNAVVKLAAFGLDEWLQLDVGAYGSDAVDRRDLVPIAIGKVARRYGRRFAPRETWIVGDTPRDLECARAGGARCLLVGTGRYAAGDLEDLGADAVLDDLADVDRVVSLLGS
ncbi:MAG TPA: HAD hydrolase-like protein [Acidimicrobiales bacterium]|nr:HAD hydrolase-like protein [Acidimicrobiales bacterium]